MSGPLITLTTDYGVSSPYVAELKAVLYSACPEARLVDVTHAIPPGSLRHAELVLRRTAFAFPLGTVHVVVVDPGVGGARRGLAVAARGLFFVGPDNGTLAHAHGSDGACAVVLDRPELFRTPVAPTFHGRDVFAPVAAELASGLPLADVGSSISTGALVGTTLPAPELGERRARGQILGADTFGNLTSNIPARHVEGFTVKVAGRTTARVRTYAEGPANTLLALAGSDGYLEIAVRDGSAARALGTEVGLEIVCEQP